MAAAGEFLLAKNQEIARGGLFFSGFIYGAIQRKRGLELITGRGNSYSV